MNSIFSWKIIFQKSKLHPNQTEPMRKNKRDRLSSLPVEILLEILSHLPITTAITTSVLSHQWRYLWTQLTTFRFPKDAFRNPEKHDFFNIVDHIITRQLVLPIIHTFHLHFPNRRLDAYNSDDHRKKCHFYLKVWVTLICGRGVREIKVSSDFDILAQPPACLFDSPSLVVLDLSSGFRFSLLFNEGVRNSISPCNLVKLHLHSYGFDCESLQMLFKSCALLENLSLAIGSGTSYCSVFQPFELNISGPKLKRLSLFFGEMGGCLKKSLQGHRVSIGAPNLEYFGVSDRNESAYTFEEPSSVLIEADICFYQEPKFFPAISDVRKLTLRYAGKFIEKKGGILLKYRNLTSLSTHIPYRWDDLMRLLKCAPNLEALELNQELCGTEMMLSKIPTCLSTKIKKVTLLKLDGTKLEVELIRYLVRYARGMEILDISMHNSQNEKEQLCKEAKFCKELTRLSGHPPNCKVRFIFGSKEVDEHAQHVVVRWKMSLVFPSQESKLAALEYFNSEGEIGIESLRT